MRLSTTNVRRMIEFECNSICELLLEKNKAYGNSALEPIQIFSKEDPLTQINVRIDDKLNRIKKGQEYIGEDTITDLIGYLILRKVAMKILEEMHSDEPLCTSTNGVSDSFSVS